MQGTVIMSIKCSIQMETLDKECLSTGEGVFKYKDCFPIPPLGMVSLALQNVDTNGEVRGKDTNGEVRGCQDPHFL